MPLIDASSTIEELEDIRKDLFSPKAQKEFSVLSRKNIIEPYLDKKIKDLEAEEKIKKEQERKDNNLLKAQTKFNSKSFYYHVDSFNTLNKILTSGKIYASKKDVTTKSKITDQVNSNDSLNVDLTKNFISLSKDPNVHAQRNKTK